LPRFMPVAKGIDGMCAVYDPKAEGFHDNTMRLIVGREGLSECPFKA
jgi:hypothetical protein